jgi:hypothetical protein
MNDAQRNELERIRLEHGGLLKPADVVAAAVPKKSILHDLFTWDDTEAAAKFRLVEAQRIIRVVVTVVKEDHEPVRAYVSLLKDRDDGNGYRHVLDVLKSDDDREDMLKTAMAELQAFKRKYQRLSELAPLFDAIDGLEAALTAPPA